MKSGDTVKVNINTEYGTILLQKGIISVDKKYKIISQGLSAEKNYYHVKIGQSTYYFHEYELVKCNKWELCYARFSP